MVKEEEKGDDLGYTVEWVDDGTQQSYLTGENFMREEYHSLSAPEINLLIVGHNQMMIEHCQDGRLPRPRNNAVLEKLFILETTTETETRTATNSDDNDDGGGNRRSRSGDDDSREGRGAGEGRGGEDEDETDAASAAPAAPHPPPPPAAVQTSSRSMQLRELGEDCALVMEAVDGRASMEVLTRPDVASCVSPFDAADFIFSPSPLDGGGGDDALDGGGGGQLSTNDPAGPPFRTEDGQGVGGLSRCGLLAEEEGAYMIQPGYMP